MVFPVRRKIGQAHWYKAGDHQPEIHLAAGNWLTLTMIPMTMRNV